MFRLLFTLVLCTTSLFISLTVNGKANLDPLSSIRFLSENFSTCEKLFLWSSSSKGEVFWDRSKKAICYHIKYRPYSKLASREELRGTSVLYLKLPNDSYRKTQGLILDVSYSDCAAILASCWYLNIGDKTKAGGFPRTKNSWQRIPIVWDNGWSEPPCGQPGMLRIVFWISANLPKDIYIWFRNVYLIDGVKCNNLIRNGSFEQSLVGNWPIGWGTGHWGVRAEPWVSRKELFGEDLIRVKKGIIGTYCMKLSTNRLILKGFAISGLQGDYVFSAYMRAEGKPVRVAWGFWYPWANSPTKMIPPISTEWKRYFQRVHFACKTTFLNGGPVFQLMDKGVVYIDGVQLEKAMLPSDYVENIGMGGIIESGEFAQTSKFAIQLDNFTNPPICKVRKVSVDTSRSCICIDGQPRFIYGITLETLPSDSFAATIAKQGFNTVLQCIGKHTDIKAIKHTLDTYAKLGLNTVIWFFIGGQEKLAFEPRRKFFEALKNHPSIIFWDILDEPSPKWSDAAIENLYKACKSADITRPMYINYSAYLPIRKNLIGDIVSVDYYPISEGHSIIYSLDNMDVMIKRAPNKPKLIFLNTCGYAYTFLREETPAECYVQVYGAMIKGLAGVFAFAHRPYTQPLWQALKQIGYEIRILEQPLLAGSLLKGVRVIPDNIAYRAVNYDGKIYLITVNKSSYQIQAKIILDKKLETNYFADVLFEDRTVDIKAGLIRDAYQPFERHVYLIGTR